MSGACTIPSQVLCGCCAGIGNQTPQVIDNRPALSAIVYRAGTYSTFNASLLASLSDPDYPALALLRTRDTSDFTIALLDAWSIVGDILTFYQERFANEAYLRTAVDQRSVFELARLVGYVPSPGVAASDVLAFTLSSAPGSPDNVLIPVGSRVQSIPGPGQMPQVFETSSDITAVIAWNALPAQTVIPWQIQAPGNSTWIRGTANNISVGDVLLFLNGPQGQPTIPASGDLHYVTAVSIDSNAGNTQITWDSPLSDAFTAGSSDVNIYVFRKKAALYGVQAANPLTLPTSHTKLTSLPGYPSGTATDWDYTVAYADYSNQINLDAAYSGLVPPQGGPLQWAILTGLGYTSFFQVTASVESNPNLFTLTSKTTKLTLALGQILIGDPYLSLNELLWEFVGETRNITAYVQSVPLTPVDLPLTSWSLDSTYTKQTGMLAPVEGTTITVVGGQQIAAGQPIGVSGKRVRLQVTTGSNATFVPANASGALAVSDGQIFLIDSFPPTTDPTTGNPLWSVLTLSGVPGSLVVTSDNVTLVPSVTADPIVGEANVAQSTSVNGNLTTLTLTQSLSRIYDCPTVAVNANAVSATNGETMQEILGNGDATNAALEFTLKQSPLTYVSAPVGTGVQSTLQVWVNNLRWHEAPNFLSSGPADRVFVTHVNASGNVIVQFGNGINGSRTPTGQANIRAIYRKGIGIAGMVSAGQLSQPLDRPQGLKSATNPSPASGAADPASADDARASAPLPTLTLSRIVSLEDYQNYALAFPGIAKALATWTWFGSTRGVFLTVAGEGGAVLESDDNIIVNLVQALRSFGNPYVPLTVASYSPVLFQLAAKILIDSNDYAPPQVLAQVWQNLTAAFAFSVRLLGQNIVASEIIEIIQQTPGVIAVQLQSLNLSGATPTASVPPVLCASSPSPGMTTTPSRSSSAIELRILKFPLPFRFNPPPQPPQPAQMLLLDPATVGSLGVWS
jgi:hypothetical protein